MIDSWLEDVKNVLDKHPYDTLFHKIAVFGK